MSSTPPANVPRRRKFPEVESNVPEVESNVPRRRKREIEETPESEVPAPRRTRRPQREIESEVTRREESEIPAPRRTRRLQREIPEVESEVPRREESKIPRELREDVNKYSEFSDSDFILNPRGPAHEYVGVQKLQEGKKTEYVGVQKLQEGKKTEVCWNLHSGQRKLLLSEIEFLTRYLDMTISPTPLVIYAGAASGRHIPFLSMMFPQVTFHLWDPAEFEIEKTDRIQIYNELFTKEVISTEYSNPNFAKNIYFISDIRTADFIGTERKYFADRFYHAIDEKGREYWGDDKIPPGVKKLFYIDRNGNPPPAIVEAEIKALSSEESEGDILQDLIIQREWLLQLKPYRSHLKFRLPYPGKIPSNYYPYFRGTVYYQPWNRCNSQEMRLVPETPLVQEEWNIVRYDMLLAYQNRVRRPYKKYLNPFTHDRKPIDHEELLNDFDSTLEAKILELYFRRIGVEDAKLQERVVGLSRVISRVVSSPNFYRSLQWLRGTLVEPPPFSEIIYWEDTELGIKEAERKQKEAERKQKEAERKQKEKEAKRKLSKKKKTLQKE